MRAFGYGLFPKSGRGLPSSISRSLVYHYNRFDGVNYINKIGMQDREAVGGQVFSGRGYALDGVDQYIEYPRSALNAGYGSISISFWYKPSVTAGVAQYIAGFYGSNSIMYLRQEDTGGLRWYFSGNLILQINIRTAANVFTDTSKWYHILIAADRVNDTGIMYIDGVQMTLSANTVIHTEPVTDATAGFRIGRYANTYGALGIRDLRVWNSYISSDNTEALMRSEIVDSDNLLLWDFCEGNSTTVSYDASGNDNHGTCYNFDGTSFVEGVWQSLMNKYGYAEDIYGGDEYTPPDMSFAMGPIPLYDLEGNDLVFRGQAKYNAIARNAACFVGDGTTYFTVSGLLTTDVITALSIDLPTCTIDGRLDVANGDTVYGITVTRGGVVWAYYPVVEGAGNKVYDVSGNGNHLTAVGISGSNWGLIDYPEEDYIARRGVTVVEWEGSTFLVPFTESGQSQYASVAPVIDADEVATDYAQNGKQIIPKTYFSFPQVYELVQADIDHEFFDEITREPDVVAWEYVIGTKFNEDIWYVNYTDRKDFLMLQAWHTLTYAEINKIKQLTKQVMLLIDDSSFMADSSRLIDATYI